jgi:hypothetical protein
MFELLEAIPLILHSVELSPGELPGFLQDGELRVQFVEGDQPLRDHVLEACAPLIDLRDLPQPYCSLLNGVAAHPSTLLLDQLLEAHSDALGLLESQPSF